MSIGYVATDSFSRVLLKALPQNILIDYLTPIGIFGDQKIKILSSY
ncbi:MAG: hypothetical protein VYA34_02845 [Myxococcota bacterium]|nr:hypothetical protein [Myxococcota bacterium]